jgi:rare lipoprotein A
VEKHRAGKNTLANNVIKITARALTCLLVMLGLAACATQPRPSSIPPEPPAAIQPPPAPAPAPAPRQQPAVSPQALEAGPFFTQIGLASFYGRAHLGKLTASGDRFDHRDFTAAHLTLAFGTLVRVTNLANGRTVTVRVTDRGPKIKTRIIDVSLAAAQALGMQQKGVTRVRLEAFAKDQASSQ